MLSKEHFKEFIDEVNTTHFNFRVWMYTNNEWVKLQDECKDKHIVKHMNLVLSALQLVWLLGIARLLDPAYFRNDKNKPRLSVKYVLAEAMQTELSAYYDSEMKEQDMQEFASTNRELRNEKIGHKTPGSKINRQAAGAEKFFEIIEYIIKELKKHDSLNISRSINYEFFNILAQENAEIFIGNFNSSANSGI